MVVITFLFLICFLDVVVLGFRGLVAHGFKPTSPYGSLDCAITLEVQAHSASTGPFFHSSSHEIFQSFLLILITECLGISFLFLFLFLFLCVLSMHPYFFGISCIATD